MKFLASIILLLWALTINAQEKERTGQFQNSADIETTGKVVVKSNKKGKVSIILQSDFKTQSGPDLDVYLSKTKKVDDSSVRVDKLILLEGRQRYGCSQDIKIDDYDYVIIHCTKYNHWYGWAKLSE